MPNYGMLIDLTTCVACDACVIACDQENHVPAGYKREWTERISTGRFPELKAEFYSNRCQHCNLAPCVSACPTKASYTHHGNVLVDANKCVGCQHCIAACPYGARYLHPDGYVDKCTHCNHRLEEGRDPACVEICPTYSLVFGDLNDKESRISKLIKEREYKLLKPEKGTDPKYKLLTSIVK